MRKVGKYLIGLALMAVVGVFGGVVAMAEDSVVTPNFAEMAMYTGRFDFSLSAGPIAAWSGSTITGRFSGTGIGATLRPSGSNVWVSIIIDGKLTSSFKLTAKKKLTLAENLPDGEHTVEIVKRSEGGEGDIQFMGFEPTSQGCLLPPPSPSSRRIAFIGDSITCGYGTAGKPEAPWDIANEDFTDTFAYLTAKFFNADYQAIAWSGKGMYQNYNPETKSPTMPELYNQTRPSKAKLMWDMKSWIPDVIVINLGTNDFYKSINPDKFIATYVSFIKTLRGYYPNATIFCTLIARDDVTPHIKKVVEVVNATSDTMVHSFFFSPEDIARNGAGSGAHPSKKTHAIMAGELETEIKKVMAW